MLKQCLVIVVVCVLLRRPGSIIADYEFESTTSSPNTPEFIAANTQLISALKDRGITVAPNPFAQSGKGCQQLILKNIDLYLSFFILDYNLLLTKCWFVISMNIAFNNVEE